MTEHKWCPNCGAGIMWSKPYKKWNETYAQQKIIWHCERCHNDFDEVIK